MLLSSRNLRKLKRLRRRAWVAAMLLGFSGCAYLGGKLALAHTQPAPVLPDTASLPHYTLCAQTAYADWLGEAAAGSTVCVEGRVAAQPVDALADPRLHAFEESCNDTGCYEGEVEDFELQATAWKYSSLEGLTTQAAEAGRSAAPVDESRTQQLKALGWDETVPLWALVTPHALQRFLPAELRIGSGVQAIEARLWPQQSRGQFSVALAQPLDISENKQSLADVWKQLPSARMMVCMRREVSAALCRAEGDVWRVSLLRRLLLPSEHWVGLAVEQELSPTAVGENWERLHQGWLPTSCWGDYTADSVGSAQHVGVAARPGGTLFHVGMAAESGTHTVPWEGWQPAGQPEDWVGAGRFDWRQGPSDVRRVEWVAQNAGTRLVFHFRWSGAPVPDESEVATMGADEETLYTPNPNVIAGQ
jgi:hypothetical protein